MFRDRLKEKFGLERVEELEKVLRMLLWDACTIWTKTDARTPATVLEDRVSPCANDPDYAQAYGIVQGLSIALGISSVGPKTDPNSPMKWFDGIYDELKIKAFVEGYIFRTYEEEMQG